MAWFFGPLFVVESLDILKVVVGTLTVIVELLPLKIWRESNQLGDVYSWHKLLTF